MAVVVVDASNLDRNMYLLTQVMETGLPVVLALNMSDTAKARGIEIDVEALSKHLGIPVVALVARSGLGVDELRDAIIESFDAPAARPSWNWPDELGEAVAEPSSRRERRV